MKKFIFMIALLSFTIGAIQAQNSTQTRKEAKIEAKAKAKAARDAERDARDAMVQTEDMQNFLAAKKAIQSLSFVLEGQQLQLNQAQTSFVNPTTNFIVVNGNTATVQIASNYGLGANGLGGITVQGTTTNVQAEVDNKGNVNFTMMVLGTGISAQVSIILYHGSGQAQATITPNFNNRRLYMTGNLVPAAQSNIFQGRVY